MAVADAASVRTVAVQLRALSSDEENQPIIAREEGCMRALCGFIVGDDIEVASIAVAALKNLAAHPDNYQVLRSEEGLVDGLKELILVDQADKDLRRDIFHILEELTDENNEDELDDLDDIENSAGLKQPSTTNALDDDPNLLKDPVTSRLHIAGISEDVMCARVEQLIIQKRGVISVSFEMGAEIAVVFTRFPPDQLSSFLSKMTGIQVELLPDESEDDDEEDEELFASQNASINNNNNNISDNNNNNNNNNSQSPGYLDETGQRLRDVAKRNAKKKHTITQGASSLHERLKAQREEESRRKARANRLMDSIGRGVRSGWGFF